MRSGIGAQQPVQASEADASIVHPSDSLLERQKQSTPRTGCFVFRLFADSRLMCLLFQALLTHKATENLEVP